MASGVGEVDVTVRSHNESGERGVIGDRLSNRLSI